MWNACVFSFKLSYDSGRILKYLSGLLPHELSLFSCLSLTHIFKTSGLLISNISELNSVHRNNTSVRQESFNHLAFNKYYFTSEISMSGSFQLCFYLIIEQTFCPPKKDFKNPQIVEIRLNLKFQTRYQVRPSGVSGGRLEEDWTEEQGHTSGCCIWAYTKNMSLHCAEWDSMSYSNVQMCMSGGNQGLALFNRVPLLWGNSPWGR